MTDPQPLPLKTSQAFDAAAFGEQVRAKLDAGNLTFRTAAKRIGVSSATLNRVARGNDPDVHSYLKIAAWISPPQRDLTAPSSAGDVLIAKHFETLQAVERVLANGAQEDATP